VFCQRIVHGKARLEDGSVPRLDTRLKDHGLITSGESDALK
jgi:hypothetical protein